MHTPPPGDLIRDLRKERNLSIESLAAEADITTLALSNVELKSAKPQRENLIKVLDALNTVKPVPIGKRQEILQAFGYLDVPGLPNAEDIARAIAGWKEPFRDTPIPAYLLDYAQRIHDWNDQVLAMLETTRESMEGVTLFDILFSPHFRGKLKLLNEEDIVKKAVQQMWQEYQGFIDQEWCQQCLADARLKYPAFGALYDSFSETHPIPVDIRSMEPAILEDKEGNVFKFRVVGIDLVSDPRFRAIQYVPQDAATLQRLATLFPA